MDDRMREGLGRIVLGERLTLDQAEALMDALMDGAGTPAQVGGVLVGLAARGETASEIAGFARSMRRHAPVVPIRRRPLLDTCGTGGDGSHSFNISTAAGLVVAAAGVPVAKHGNRAASSKSGSADILEALGVGLSPDPALVARSVDEIGFGFLFAQHMHRAMRHVGPIRSELQVRTVFNLLGPLTNPANPERQLIGIFDGGRLDLVAEVLVRLGADHALVVHGEGLDEVTLSGPTRYARVDRGRVTIGTVTPEEFGLPTYPRSAWVGGDAAANAGIMRAILAGEKGPYRDVVVANAAAALVAARAASGWNEGARMAEAAIDGGGAAEVLARLTAFERGVAASNVGG